MKKLILVVAVLMVLGAVAAQADSNVTYTSTITQSGSTWSANFIIPKWDASWGTLTEIDWSIAGTITGDIGFENQDNVARNVSSQISAQFTITRYPDGTNGSKTATAIESFSDLNVPAFDGVINYGGTSGKTYLNLSTTSVAVTDSTNLFPWNVEKPTIFTYYTGTGNVLVPATGLGTSTANGPASVSFHADTASSATLGVTYHWDEGNGPPHGTPELGTFALMGLSMLPMAGVAIRRRRRSA